MNRRNINILLITIAVVCIGIPACIWFISSPGFFVQFPDATALENYLSSEFTMNHTNVNEVLAHFEEKLVSFEYCSEPHESGSGLAVRCDVNSEWFQGVTNFGWRYYLSFLFNADSETLLYINVRRVYIGF